MRVSFRTFIATFALSAVAAAPASTQTFFGEDVDGSEYVRSSLTNALSAEALFLANLTGVGTETFDSGFALGSTAPLGLNFGATGTATLNGGGCVSNWSWSACSNPYTAWFPPPTPLPGPGGTNGFGRYSVDTSDNGGKYWEANSNNFWVNFSNPIAAFGFFGIDIGDFGGSLSLAFMNGATRVATRAINFTSGVGGAAFFWGVIDTSATFDAVVFQVTSGGSDVFAFDNMTIGTTGQVGGDVVPEPSTWLLLATGLLGMAMVARRRGGWDSILGRSDSA